MGTSISVSVQMDFRLRHVNDWSSDSRMVSVHLLIFLMFYAWLKIDTDGIQTGQTAPVSAAFKI